MMGLDVYSMATTRRAELERALRRQELLRQAGFVAGPSAAVRLGGAVGRLVRRERAARSAAPSMPPIYCLTTRGHEPV